MRCPAHASRWSSTRRTTPRAALARSRCSRRTLHSPPTTSRPPMSSAARCSAPRSARSSVPQRGDAGAGAAIGAGTGMLGGSAAAANVSGWSNQRDAGDVRPRVPAVHVRSRPSGAGARRRASAGTAAYGYVPPGTRPAAGYPPANTPPPSGVSTPRGYLPPSTEEPLGGYPPANTSPPPGTSAPRGYLPPATTEPPGGYPPANTPPPPGTPPRG